MYKTKLAGIKKAALVSVILGYILFVVQIVLFVRKGFQVDFGIGLKGVIFFVAPALGMYWPLKKLDDEYMLKTKMYCWPIFIFVLLLFFGSYAYLYYEITKQHAEGFSSVVFMIGAVIFLHLIPSSIAKERKAAE
jgi:hypothetical protein